MTKGRSKNKSILADSENKYISLAEASELCEYSQEYLSLRARQGKLKAVKLGRNWVTTKEWLNDYINRYISLAEASELCEYSQEYLSLRARQGKLKAVKLGRNWMTTREWLESYLTQISLLEKEPFEESLIVGPTTEKTVKKSTFPLIHSLVNLIKYLLSYRIKVGKIRTTYQLILQTLDKWISQPIDKVLAFIETRKKIVLCRIREQSSVVYRFIRQPKFALSAVLIILFIFSSVLVFSPAARNESGRILIGLKNSTQETFLETGRGIVRLAQGIENNLVEVPTIIRNSGAKLRNYREVALYYSARLSSAFQLGARGVLTLVRDLPQKSLQLSQEAKQTFQAASQKNEEIKLSLKFGLIRLPKESHKFYLSLQKAIETAQSNLLLGAERIKAAIPKYITKLQDLPQVLAREIKSIPQNMRYLLGRTSDMVKTAPDYASDMLKKLSDTAKKAGNKLIYQVQRIQERLILLSEQNEKAKEKISGLIKGLPKIVYEWLNEKKSQTHTILSQAKDIINVILNEVKDSVEMVIEPDSSLKFRMTEGLAGIFDSLNNFSQKLDQVSQKVKSALGDAYIKVAEFLIHSYSFEKTAEAPKEIQSVETKEVEKSIVQEIIKKEEKAKITEVTKTKELTKETTKEVVKVTEVSQVVQPADLTLINSRLSSLETQLNNFKSQVVSKVDYTVPSYAPTYIPSAGLQVSGHALLTSLNVSGSAAVGGSLAVRENSSFGNPKSDTDAFDVYANATFHENATFNKGLSAASIGTSGNFSAATSTISQLTVNNDLLVSRNATTTGSLYIGGDLIVAGAQAYSGAASFTATSTSPALSVRQNGTGAIVDFKDGANSVFTIADGGSMTIANASSTSNILSLTASSTNTHLLFKLAGAGPLLNITNNTDASKLYINNNGNVGIGTTSPSTLLSVAGQCVTGDTRLRLRRKKSKVKSQKSKLQFKIQNEDEKYYYGEIAIKDIQPGDEIQSLDEKTGQLVWSRVNALMDMGVKTTYKLTTASGRQIRTTDNHPYLTQGGWKKVKELKAGMPIAAPKVRFSKTYAFIDASNIIYGADDHGWKMDFAKLIKYLKTRFGAERVLYYGGVDNRNKRQLNFYNKLKEFGYDLRLNPLKSFVNNKGEFYQKADIDARMAFEAMKYKDEYDKAIFLTGDGDFYWVLEYLFQNKEIYLLAHSRRTARELKQLAKARFTDIENLKKYLVFDDKKATDAFEESVAGIMPLTYQAGNNLSRGDVVDKDIMWDTIISIEKVGEEQVYDIEVEGTHNFIGNDIVAHNTYITGGLGVGALNTQAGSILATGYGQFNNVSTTDSLSIGGLASSTLGFRVKDKFTIDSLGNATTTGSFDIANLRINSSYWLPASDGSSNQIMSTNGSGQLSFVNAAGIGSNWNYFDATTIKPTTTVGIYVSASSTIASNFRVDGNSTTTGSFSMGNAVGNVLTINAGRVSYANNSTSTIPNDANAWRIATTTTAEKPILSIDGVNGRVGIGTAGPKTPLHLFNAPITLNNSNSLYGEWLINTTIGLGASYGLLIYNQGTSGDFSIRANNTGDVQFILKGSTGNVGIGTTTPFGRLSVHAKTNDAYAENLFIVASSSNGLATTTHFVITNDGNVGIGTTTPSTLLSVAGQCVTGDTRLRRRRKRKKISNSKFLISNQIPNPNDENSKLENCKLKIDEEYIYDEVKIKDIQPGDEIQSLDEKTGKLVWSRVNALMDMGKRQTYLLLTSSGKMIRTTANHPYFVRQSFNESGLAKNQKAPQYARLFDAESNGVEPYPLTGPHCYQQAPQSIEVYSPSLLRNSNYNLTRIKNNIFSVEDAVFGSERISAPLADNYWQYNSSENPVKSLSVENKKELYSSKINVSRRDKWIKVKDIKVGSKVATTDGWETIIVIKPVAQEQVYDIEVEGTHNFIGNDIVAHNTYITGGLGVGALNTTAGSILATSYGKFNNVSTTDSLSVGGLASSTLGFRIKDKFTIDSLGNATTTGSFDIANLRINSSYWLPTLDGSSNQILSTNGTGQLSFTDAAGIGSNWNWFDASTIKPTTTVGFYISASSTIAANFRVDGNVTTTKALSVGSNALVVRDNGNLGIGTTSPASLLTLAQKDDTHGYRVYGYDDRSNDYGEMYVDSSGNTRFDDSNDYIYYNGWIFLDSSNGLKLYDSGRNIFGTDNDYTIAYNSASDNFEFLDGSTVGTNVRMVINNSGNVGIGTTTPFGRLSVHAKTNDTYAENLFIVASSSNGLATTSLFVITNDGNVGIGTTTPSTLLSVAGQCVTGDTRLRLRRKKSKVKSQKSKLQFKIQNEDEKYYYGEIAIKDIQPGDEIQSLDEKTGQLVWSRVNALMDMGVKPIYKLTTESGKTIRTTGNHPYLVIKSDFSRKELFSLRKSNISDSFKFNDRKLILQRMSSSFLKKTNRFFNNLFFAHSFNVDNDYAAGARRVKNREIPEIFIKTKQNKTSLFSIIKNFIIRSFGQAKFRGADNFDIWHSQCFNQISMNAVISENFKHNLSLSKLMKNFSRAFQYAGSEFNSCQYVSFGNSGILLRNLINSVSVSEQIQNISNRNSGASNTGFAESNFGINSDSIHNLNNTKKEDLLSSARWTKVSEIKQGQFIAVSSGNNKKSVFEKITKIEILPPEQVYDIEVEGTHNFIGNDIVAHNTYITGGLGVGVLNTTAGSILATSYGQFNNVSTTDSLAVGGLASSTLGFRVKDKFTIDSLGNATTTGSLTIASLTGSTQCLQVDTNGLVGGTGSACGGGGGGGAAWQIYNNNPVWLTPTTTGAGIYLTRSATTTENMYFGGLQFTKTGDNYLYFDNAQTNYLQWNDAKDWFALSNDLDITGIASTTGGFRLNDKFRMDSLGNATTTGSFDIANLRINSSYWLPTTDGSSNQIMSTNGSGQLSFVNAAGIGSNWNYFDASTIKPTTTVGIYISASSTIASNFRVDGNVTTTKALSVGSNALVVRDDGRVGIASSSPNNKLDVAGFIDVDKFSGYKQAGYTILKASSTNFGLFAGEDAGRDILADGLRNTFLGYHAGLIATSSDDNTFIGYNAGDSNIGGDSNTAVGSYALQANTTGYYNSAIGNVSLNSNTTGIYNTAMGRSSLQDNTTGYSNTAVGTYSLQDNISGSSNAALGVFSLYFNTTGSNNTAIGRESFYTNPTGAGNIALGYQAGFYATTTADGATASSYNTIIGYQAGFTAGAVEQISGNVFLGYRAGYNDIGNENIVIGYNKSSVDTSGNYQLRIGNSQGDFIVGDTNRNIGIGTTTPFAKLALHAKVNDAYNENLFLIASSTNNATTTHFVITNDGNVGVATTSPSTTLSVAGQCVTGDTRLRLRRKKSKVKNQKSKSQFKIQNEDEKYYYGEIAIKDIQPGDEIQSLDEKTGQLVWSRVNALMDMGVKPIYKIITASGKTIRTTGNHPYLTLKGWQKVMNLGRGAKIAVPKTKALVKYQKPKVGVFIDDANMFYGFKKYDWRIDLRKLKSLLNSSFDINFVNYYLALPDKKDTAFVKTQKYLKKIEKQVNIITKPLKYIYDRELNRVVKKGNLDTEIVIDVIRHLDELDGVVILSGDSDFKKLAELVIGKGKKIIFVGYEGNMAWELRQMHHLYLEHYRGYLELGNKKAPKKIGVPLLSLIYAKEETLSRVEAVDKKDIFFDEIINIKHLPAEQVYDIEVEGTHNFIGNDIVAHNTYITGGLGVGALNTQTGSVLATSYGKFNNVSTTDSLSVGGLASSTLGFRVKDKFTIDSLGNATNTGSFNIANLRINSSYWLPTADGSSNQILSTNGTGQLSFRDAAGLGSNWNYFDASTIKPTTTVGIYISASSTIASNFRVDGNSTTTGSFSMGNASGNVLTINAGRVSYANNSTTTIPNDANAWRIATTTTADKPILSIDGVNGNVGIGTASPDQTLVVNGGLVKSINVGPLGFVADYTGGKAAALTAGTLRAAFLYDDSGSFSIQRTPRASVLTGTASAANSVFEIDSSGNLGIGTTTPFARLALHAKTNDTYAENLFIVASSSNGLATTTHFVITNDGQVGISSSTPSTNLSVAGSGYFTGGLGVGALNTTAGSILATGYGQFNNVSTTDSLSVGGLASSTLGFRIKDKFTIDSLGNATTTGSFDIANLRINSSYWLPTLDGSSNQILSTNGTGQLSFVNAAGIGSNWNYFDASTIKPTTTVGFYISASSTIAANFRVDGNVTTTQALSVGSNALVVRDNGYVGIGTAEPVRPLHIQGADTFLRADRIGASYGASWLLTRMSNSSTVASSWLFGPANVAGASGDDFTIVDYGTAIEGTSGKVSLLIDKTTSNVGIGTTTPFAKLALHAQVNDAYNENLFLVASSTNNATTTHFVITNDGNVGISSSTPSTNLSVAGSGYFTGGLGVGALNTQTGSVLATSYGKFNNVSTTDSLSIGGLASSTLGFRVNDKFVVNNSGGLSMARGTTTDTFYVGNLTAASCDVKADESTGRLYCGSDASGGGTGSNWLWGANQTYIYPSTTVGIIVQASSTFASNLKITDNVTTTKSFTFTNYLSCTALETDANGLMVCGTDDTGSGGGGAAWQIYNNNPVWLTPTTTGAGIYLTRSATTTENMYFGGLQFTRAGDNYLYFDNAQTNYLQWNDAKDWFALSNDLEVTGIASTTGGFRLNDKFRVDSSGNATTSGNLIIGASSWASPTSTLTVSGSAYFTGNASTSGALAVGVNNLVVRDNGRVGIGTTNPSDLLTIAGNTTGRVKQSIQNLNATSKSAELVFTSGGAGGWWTIGTDDDFNGGDNLYIWGGGAGDTRFFINGDGNVGIGTTTPGYKLTVNGTDGTTNLFQIATTTNQGLFTINNQGWAGFNTTSPADNFAVGGNAFIGGNMTITGNCAGCGNGERVVIKKAADESVSDSTLQNDNDFVVSQSANETWVYQFTLHATSTGEADFKYAVTAPAGAKCGFIGQTVKNTDWATDPYPNGCNETSAAVNFKGGSADFYDILLINGTVITNATAGNITLQWAQNTTRATHVLNVASSSHMIAFKITGADLAEVYYTSDNAVWPGTIVSSVGGLNVKTASSMSPAILGVVSEKPGFAIGEAEPINLGRPVFVALSGRVPVRVNLEGGEIKLGDRIAVSSIPGIGMKATSSSTTLGIALEDFDETKVSEDGTGKILMFVNLGESGVKVQGERVDDLTLRIEDLEALISPISTSSESFNDSLNNTDNNGLFSLILAWFENIGVSFWDGIVSAKEFIADKITAKKAVLEQLEMKDSATGEIYCVSIANGEWNKTQGACPASAETSAEGSYQSQEVPIQETPIEEVPSQEQEPAPEISEEEPVFEPVVEEVVPEPEPEPEPQA